MFQADLHLFNIISTVLSPVLIFFPHMKPFISCSYLKATLKIIAQPILSTKSLFSSWISKLVIFYRINYFLFLFIILEVGLQITVLSDTSIIMQAIADIGKEEGLKGYWKGNLPQVLDILYHAYYGSCMVYLVALADYSS